MESSILASVKKLLNIAPDDTEFDTDVIFHTNSVFSTLEQLGLPEFMIEGSQETWASYPNQDPKVLNMIKPYVPMKVRVVFDPPSNSTVLQSLKESILESEWRIRMYVGVLDQSTP